MNKVNSTFKVIMILTLPIALFAQSDFVWAPIAETDWQVAEDSTKGIRDAVMIFEKIVANERQYFADKCIYSIYRRIRILSAKGKKWADFSQEYMPQRHKIMTIQGRTILPDGRIVPLSPSQIIDKEIIKAKGIRISQKAFSLPAVSDDCIIEYYMELESNEPRGYWPVQKNIYLNKGELIWKFYRGRGIDGEIYRVIGIESLIPNYCILHLEQDIDIKKSPNIKQPDMIVFSVSDVPAFEPEPFSFPDIALKGQLRYYYSALETAPVYWGNTSTILSQVIDEFTRKNRRLVKLVANWRSFSSEKAKIDTAYYWLQNNIEKYNPQSTNRFKKNSYVDHVLRRGYGSSYDINIVFYDMLRELNIDAKIAFAIDRDENAFAYKAKTWQFDRSLVAIPNTAGEYDFYDAGDEYLPPGLVGWYNEGTFAFVINDFSKQFHFIPASTSNTNKLRRYQELTIEADWSTAGLLSEKRTGHFARDLRLQLSKMTQKEKITKLEDSFTSDFPLNKIESVRIENLEMMNKDVEFQIQFHNEQIGQKMRDFVLLKPFDLFSAFENPFGSESRKRPIVFDYASQVTEILHLNIPDGWVVEAMPSDTSFTNSIGTVKVSFRQFSNDKSITIQHQFEKSLPIYKAEAYQEVRQLYKARKSFEGMTILFNKI